MVSSVKAAPDGGWGWMCVLGMIYSYICIMGTQSSFGIIYIDLIDYFDTGREEAAWIGSLTSGLVLLIGPLSSAVTRRFGIQKTAAVGALLAFSGCFISGFATGIPYLYVSYGVINGIGLGLVLVPCILVVVQYFERRLALATTFGSIGTGLGALVLPPLYTYLLEEYTWRGTFVILSGIMLNLLVCAVIFIPPPHLQHKMESRSSTHSTSVCSSFRYLCNPCFILYTVGMALVFLGYVVPFIHLPDMAVLGGIEKYQAAYLVSIIGIFNIVGRIMFGCISNFQCTNVIFLQAVSLMICSVSTAVCPHLSQFYALAVYSSIYGTFIGVFISLFVVATTILVGPDNTGDALGVILFLTGVTDLVASPIAGWIFDSTRTYNASFYLVSCAFFLAAVMMLLVTILHRGEKKEREQCLDISIKTVSKSFQVPHMDM